VATMIAPCVVTYYTSSDSQSIVTRYLAVDDW